MLSNYFLHRFEAVVAVLQNLAARDSYTFERGITLCELSRLRRRNVVLQ